MTQIFEGEIDGGKGKSEVTLSSFRRLPQVCHRFGCRAEMPLQVLRREEMTLELDCGL